MIYRFAQKIKSDVRDMKTQYKKSSLDSYEVSYDQSLAITPPSLYNLVTLLLSDAIPDNVGKDELLVNPQDIHESVLKTSQDIVYAVTGLHTPKHVGLAVYVYHKTRSKDIITMLSRLGLCISYSELQRKTS